MTLGAPLVFGSMRKARPLFTRNPKGWLSVVPKKLAPVVPALPPSRQPLMEEIWTPLPLAVMSTFEPALRLTVSEKPFNDRTTVPLAMPALSAKIAYGDGVNCWRGASVVKLLAKLVSTPICNQLAAPVNTAGPKSICTVNRPLVAMTPLVTTGPATALPPLLVLNSQKARLYVPLAGLPPFWSRPW